ncbi:MAG: DHHA1 domain-containing protein, partial [bacterium]
VAIGTVADIVPLLGENRVFVRNGLKALRTTDKSGLQQLMRVANLENGEITPGKVAFQLGPRLNAAGRTEHATYSVDLLTTQSQAEAGDLAQFLDRLNRGRRKLENEILAEAAAMIEKKFDRDRDYVLIAHSEGWHVGIVGIVASKILERYHRPVILLGVEDSIAKGSARSIEGFDIHHALSRCSDHLLTFGGHKMAAGLKLPVDRIESFREAINAIAREQLTHENLQPRLLIDAEVSPNELNDDLVAGINQLEPFGASNPRPVLMMRNARQIYAPRVVGTNHLKLKVECGGRNFDAIGFSMGETLNELLDTEQTTLDLAFSPMLSRWNGQENLELELKDLRFSGTPS